MNSLLRRPRWQSLLLGSMLLLALSACGTGGTGSVDRVRLSIVVNGGGSTNPAAGTSSHERGVLVVVAATGTANPITVVMNGDVDLAAAFAASLEVSPTIHSLEIQASGRGATSPAPGLYRYASGTSVEITATPEAGATFTGWGGAATGTTNPLALTVDADREITAHFSSAPATFALEILADGTGSTSPAAATHRYESRSSVQVKPCPLAVHVHRLERRGDGHQQSRDAHHERRQDTDRP